MGAPAALMQTSSPSMPRDQEHPSQPQRRSAAAQLPSTLLPRVGVLRKKGITGICQLLHSCSPGKIRTRSLL